MDCRTGKKRTMCILPLKKNKLKNSEIPDQLGSLVDDGTGTYSSKSRTRFFSIVVREVGFEPTNPYGIGS